MTPPSGDSLDREIEAALEGVNLQHLDQRPGAPTRKGGDTLYEGVVLNVHGDDVIVDLGPRMQGVVSVREFGDEPPKEGDRHRFVLRGREDELWLLSLTAARELAAWDDLQVGSHVQARVTGQNQGGLELKIGKHGAFMPSSQVSLDRDEDISRHIGQTLVCEVLEVDRGRDRVVLSRRKVQEAERFEALSAAVGKLHTGLQLTGKVTRIEPFGAFVDIGGGVEGMVHVSNLSHQRVEDPKTFLQEGQEVQVQVLDIKENGRRVSLGMKQLQPDPWDEVEAKYGHDRQVTGKVTRLADFGAFVELEPGLEGLLHVSQLGRERVRRASDVLSVGEEVTVRVQSVDVGQRRISLSRLDPRGAVIGSEDSVEAAEIERALASPTQGGLGTNLGNLFKKALEQRGQGS